MKKILVGSALILLLPGCQTTLRDYKNKSVEQSLQKYQKELVRCFANSQKSDLNSISSSKKKMSKSNKLTQGPWEKKTGPRSVRRVGVIMAWDIDVSGRVRELLAYRSKNLKTSEKKCLLAHIRKWKFEPPPYGRKVKMERPFRFQLMR